MYARRLLVLVAVSSVLLGLFAAAPGFASSGDQLWVRRYDGPAHMVDGSIGIAMSPDGSRVFVTGQSYSSVASEDIETIAYDTSNGAQLWAARFDTGDRTGEYPTGLAVSPDGSTVFVTGWGNWPETPVDLITLAYDAGTGSLIWRAIYRDQINNYQGWAIATSPDGSSVFVTGARWHDVDNVDVLTVAFDAVDGTNRWTRIFDGPDHDYDVAYAISVSPDGSAVFVAGYTGTPSVDTHWLVLSYGASGGALEWGRKIAGPDPGISVASSIAVSPEGGRIFVCGVIAALGRQIGGVIGLEASSGTVQWRQTLTGYVKGYGSANALLTSPDGGRVFVTANLPGPGREDTMVTAAFEAATGEREWRTAFVGNGNGAAGHSLAVSPDGQELFVAGTGHGAELFHDDFVTVAYLTETGARLWDKRYDGPVHSDDGAASIAVSPDGAKVFVAGPSRGVETDYDFATLAYEA